MFRPNLEISSALVLYILSGLRTSFYTLFYLYPILIMLVEKFASYFSFVPGSLYIVDQN